jgi:tetratricopeptide (TPR) repeat protein
MYKSNLRLLSVLLVLLLLPSTGAALTQELTLDAPTVGSAPPVYQEPPYGLQREKGDRASMAAYRSTVTERERQALLEEAVRWYSEALANPSDTLVSEDPAMRMDAWASVHNSRGIAYYRLGQHHLAVADYNSALELDPNPFYRKNRGLAYEALGDLEKALTDFKFYADWVSHIAGWEAEHAHFIQKVKELQQEVKVEVQAETNQTIAITSTPEGSDIVP